MPKTPRYNRFVLHEHCFQYAFQDPDIDLLIGEQCDKVIIELGCGSGAYVNGLAQLYPTNLYIGVDEKSDRLCFGADYALSHNLKNTKWLRTQVDHLTHCFPKKSIDELWITFPDPRHGRDRQKLTSPKYQTIYYELLKNGGIIHVKTDDKPFYDYTLEVFCDAGWNIQENQEDIHSQQDLMVTRPDLAIITYYESKRLHEGRKVYYIKAVVG